jgi:hypothetical protein
MRVFLGRSVVARLVRGDGFGVGFDVAALRVGALRRMAPRAVFFFLDGGGALRFPPFPDLRFAMPFSWVFEERES